MKFTQSIHFYGVNDDNTVTFYVLDEQNQKQFFRASARFKLLGELDEMEKEIELLATLGVAYVRGKGLMLQIIEVV